MSDKLLFNFNAKFFRNLPWQLFQIKGFSILKSYAPSTRAIFMRQVLFICQYTPRLHEQFFFENKRLETWIYG